jgi:hypothetical protein
MRRDSRAEPLLESRLREARKGHHFGRGRAVHQDWLGFLQAIEAENFGKLPGGVYSTSYIRQCAQAIGYDESVVLDHYYRQMGKPTTETAPSQGRFARRRSRGDDALRRFFEHVAAGRRDQHSAQSDAPA